MKLFFSLFQNFTIMLGHLIIDKFFPLCNKQASLTAKNGKILCWRRKMFIGLATGVIVLEKSSFFKCLQIIFGPKVDKNY